MGPGEDSGTRPRRTGPRDRAFPTPAGSPVPGTASCQRRIAPAAAADVFLARIAALCGRAFVTPGTASRQEFPVDAESIATFEREGLKASVTNVWAMEIEPDGRFVYELARPGGRLFRVEFDLSKPVEPPPAPWGHD